MMVIKTKSAIVKNFARAVMPQYFSSDSHQTDKPQDINLPPEPTTCCMSGCANCVWVEYAETLSKMYEGDGEKAREIILSKITDPNLKAFLSMELKLKVPNQKKPDDK